MLKSTRKRTLTKAVTWESFSTVLTAAISYPFTGSMGSSAELAIACLVVKIIFYFQHECIWNSIAWGKVPVKETKNV